MRDSPEFAVPAARRPAARPVQPRLSKDEAMSRAHALKKGIAVAAVVGFGALSGLAARNIVGVTAQASSQSSGASQSSQTAPQYDNHGSFFQQGNSGGYGFGSSGNTQFPVGGTRSS